MAAEGEHYADGGEDIGGNDIDNPIKDEDDLDVVDLVDGGESITTCGMLHSCFSE